MARLPYRKNIHSDPEMDAFMRELFLHVITNVSKEVLKDLQDIIQHEVYDKGSPRRYRRQYKSKGFYSAWYATDAGGTGDIQAAVQHVPSLMNNKPNQYIHGSNFWRITDDVRDILADIIINGRNGRQGDGHYVGPLFDKWRTNTNDWWLEERDFWTPFLEMMNKGEFDLLIKLELNKMGLTFLPN